MNHKKILNVKGSLHKNKFDNVKFETCCKQENIKYMHEINILSCHGFGSYGA